VSIGLMANLGFPIVLTTFVLSVVGDFPIDSETPVVTSSVLRICRFNLRRCS
jgi:hypothetical protein